MLPQTKKCGECGKEFKSSSARNRHENTVHGGGRQFLCPVCYTFTSSRIDVVKHHILVKHPGYRMEHGARFPVLGDCDTMKPNKNQKVESYQSTNGIPPLMQVNPSSSTSAPTIPLAPSQAPTIPLAPSQAPTFPSASTQVLTNPSSLAMTLSSSGLAPLSYPPPPPMTPRTKAAVDSILPNSGPPVNASTPVRTHNLDDTDEVTVTLKKPSPARAKVSRLALIRSKLAKQLAIKRVATRPAPVYAPKHRKPMPSKTVSVPPKPVSKPVSKPETISKPETETQSSVSVSIPEYVPTPIVTKTVTSAPVMAPFTVNANIQAPQRPAPPVIPPPPTPMRLLPPTVETDRPYPWHMVDREEINREVTYPDGTVEKVTITRYFRN